MYAGLPDEACGLLVGDPATAAVARFVACANAARSSRVYAVAPRDLMQADREAAADGLEVIGVVHSHTHTDAYPSPTDVAQVPDPGWHYVIVSLQRAEPSLRPRPHRRHADGRHLAQSSLNGVTPAVVTGRRRKIAHR